MKVALDARAYGWAGIGRYIGNFLQALSRAGGRHQFIVLTGQRNAEQISQVLPKDHFRVSVVDDSYYGWREQTLFLRQLWAVRADLFHFMHFNVPLLFRRRYVVTVHDATRFIFPGQTQQTLVKQLVYERVFQRAVTGAAGVVCVSEATRQELLSLPLRLPRLVRVVPEAAEPIFRAPVSRRARERARLLLGSSDPYLLYVGVWMNHKNLPRLLAAYVRVIERYPRLKLVITGRPRRGYVRVDYLARALGLADSRVVCLGFVSPELLPALYAEASCLLLPSLYEGFGLTGLEAAACGTPVVASNVSSLPEVLGEAAEYVNPEFVPGIASGIVRVLSDAGRREALTAKGLRRAEQFSWDQAARQTLEMYEATV